MFSDLPHHKEGKTVQEIFGALDGHDQVLYLQPLNLTMQLCYKTFGTELWAKNGSDSLFDLKSEYCLHVFQG